jgi:uncharacterized protein (TIGR00251 family)
LPWLKETPDGVQLAVRVLPRSSRNMLAGVLGDQLRIKLTAAPVEGAANKLLQRYLAELFGCGPSSVRILAGAGSRNKVVAVRGVTAAAIRAVVAAANS